MWVDSEWGVYESWTGGGTFSMHYTGKETFSDLLNCLLEKFGHGYVAGIKIGKAGDPTVKSFVPGISYLGEHCKQNKLCPSRMQIYLVTDYGNESFTYEQIYPKLRHIIYERCGHMVR